MVTLLHDAEVGQPTGTTISTGNSGGGSDTAFTTVTIAASHTFQYTNAAADHGSFGMAVQGNGVGATFGEDASRNNASLAFRGYIKFPNTMPSTTPQFWQFRTASANVVRIALNSSNQFLIQVGSAGTNAFTASALTLTTGTWYRVEMEIFSVSATVGSLAFRAYVGDSTSASANSGTLTSLNLGGTNVAVIRRGLLSSAYADIFYLDDDRVDEGVTTPIGPATGTAWTADVTASTTATITADTTRATLAAVSSSTTATITADTLRATFAQLATTTTATVTADTVRTTFGQVSVTATATVTADATVTHAGKTGDVTVTTTATIAADATRATFGQTSVPVTATVTTAATRQTLAQVTSSTTATITVTATVTHAGGTLRDITLVATEGRPRFLVMESRTRLTTSESRGRASATESSTRFTSSESSPRLAVQEIT